MSGSVKKDELLKAVADVLDEAIATYEQLEKMDLDMQPVVDPSKPASAPAAASPAPEMKKEDDKKEDDKDKKEDDKDMDKAKDSVKKEDEPKAEDKQEDERDDEESDDKLMATYKSLVAKMEKRGLVKAEPQAPIGNKSMQKSEESETAEVKKDESEEKIEALKKSFDERVEDLTKKIEGIAKAVESISKAPAAPRRGLSGATPLKKSGEAEAKPSFTKMEALDKLVELKKSGDRRVDTGLITRLEMNKMTQGDVERLNSILV